jgi:alkylated DNA repair dioxygenase AlkB
MNNSFKEYDLSGHKFWTGRLPESLMPDAGRFDELWNLHPDAFHEIRMGGQLVKTPRWQQAYGADYHYSGQVNKALPIPPPLQRFLVWSQQKIAQELNGLLLNWYDGSLGHYIGPHRDSTKNMVPGTPIVTISLGEERIFRLRPWQSGSKAKPIDFPVGNGTVCVLPWDTNQAFTHEVPRLKRQQGRRISITARAFV